MSWHETPTTCDKIKTRILVSDHTPYPAAAAAKSLQSCPTLCDSIDAQQAPLSLGFPRQGYWNGFPFPPPGNLPNPGIKPFVSCFGRWIIYLLSHLGSPRGSCWLVIILHQGLVNLFLKGQVVNILGTSGHMMSVTVIQLWLWWESSHRQYVNEWM